MASQPIPTVLAAVGIRGDYFINHRGDSVQKPQKLSAELVSMIAHEVRNGVAELRVLEDTPSRLVLEFVETPRRTTDASLAEVERIARGESIDEKAKRAVTILEANPELRRKVAAWVVAQGWGEPETKKDDKGPLFYLGQKW